MGSCVKCGLEYLGPVVGACVKCGMKGNDYIQDQPLGLKRTVRTVKMEYLRRVRVSLQLFGLSTLQYVYYQEFRTLAARVSARFPVFRGSYDPVPFRDGFRVPVRQGIAIGLCNSGGNIRARRSIFLTKSLTEFK